MKLPVSDRRIFSRLIPLPDNRRFICTGFEVPVHAIIADIRLCPLEPFDGNRPLPAVVVVSTNMVPFGVPVKIICHFRPKHIRIFNTLLIHGLVFLHILQICIFGCGSRRLDEIVGFRHEKGGL